jgi:hypothetical protein
MTFFQVCFLMIEHGVTFGCVFYWGSVLFCVFCLVVVFWFLFVVFSDWGLLCVFV